MFDSLKKFAVFLLAMTAILLTAAIEPDTEFFSQTVRGFFVDYRAVIKYADMQLQIDFIRLFR